MIDALFYEIIAVLVVTCTLTGVPEGDRISWCGEEPWHWRCDSQSCLLHSSLLLLELVSALVGDRARVAPGWMAVPSLISLMRVMPALTLTPTLPGLMRVPPSPRAPGTALLGLSGTCWGPAPVLPPPPGASWSLSSSADEQDAVGEHKEGPPNKQLKLMDEDVSDADMDDVDQKDTEIDKMNEDQRGGEDGSIQVLKEVPLVTISDQSG